MSLPSHSCGTARAVTLTEFSIYYFVYFIAIFLDLTFMENVFGLNQVMATLKFCLIIYEYDSVGKFSNHFPNFHFKSEALPREMGDFFPWSRLPAPCYSESFSIELTQSQLFFIHSIFFMYSDILARESSHLIIH